MPDIDKITNFDIWASQVVNTMTGNANAFANSDSGFLFLNKALLKNVMGRPEQLACIISHELAHITQNHTEEKRKARFKYDSIAASRISERIVKLRKRQQGNNFMAAMIAGISDSYTGTNTSVNQLSNRIALNNLASQMLAPKIIEKDMKYKPLISKSINKIQDEKWENIKHIVISHLNEYYDEGHEFIINKNTELQQNKDYSEIENKIIKILETKIRPAVARDGGDIKFKEFKNGQVKVELQGSCSGCPSSTMTLKQGVQNLLKHYVKEVNSVEAN